VHSVTRGSFRSRNKDGGHTIPSVTVENPMLYANLMSLCFMQAKLWAIKVLHRGIRILI